ncbi:MAG: 30S ribosomal protein S7 [candidate division KSB1 bacterium]|nr:30S ribosomal protein S7 [candidate division KSB1 bacterium]MDZ7301381.1 30S ribosomal protein S7 [candidate division KSB1 bacterium]MDZ7310734.1 30S ribosomal protein S7 [candidate division KSB1 bacterium]
MRRKRAEIREVLPDPKFNSTVVTRFINGLMRAGKRSLSERIFYKAIDLVGQRTGKQGLDIFYKAIENCKPLLQVKSRRVGGANYQVPVEVSPERRQALAIRWLITYARERGEKTMSEKLASELIAASNNEGNAIKKKEDTHKMAEANKAFAHFRW